LSLYFTTMWLLYPIAWGVSEGGNVIPPDSEAVFYGVLDIMTKRESLLAGLSVTC
jgi:bacteriorhodopsin